MGIDGLLGVEEGFSVHVLAVSRSFSYLVDWSEVSDGTVGIWESEEGLIKGVFTGWVEPSKVAFSAIESLAAEVCRSLASTEPCPFSNTPAVAEGWAWLSVVILAVGENDETATDEPLERRGLDLRGGPVAGRSRQNNSDSSAATAMQELVLPQPSDQRPHFWWGLFWISPKASANTI